jgi:competence protein ComEC
VRWAHALLGSTCCGLALAPFARVGPLAVAGIAIAVAAALLARADARSGALAALVVAGIVGWWWGSARLAALDRSALLARVGTAERALVETTAPARQSEFAIRVPARVLRFGRLTVSEPVLLELPAGRAPPLGARLAVLGELMLPRGPSHGFDERGWLRRQGVHVVLRGDRWRVVGHRGGLAGTGDTLHRALAGAVGHGLHGERRALVEGVVLGEDQGLGDGVKQDFRVSGLYHLLAVSGQNVAYVAGGVLAVAWLLGLPRLLGEAGALAGIVAYVLAVGFQPSVVRAGVAGVLASLAWLTARRRDRWYALLLGALALLAWNPYLVLDAGFELSFAAVVSIFTVAPRLRRAFEGWPVPAVLAETIAISAGCGLATAPVAWLQFHAVPLLTVPANALAAPAVAPLLWLALAAAAVAPVAPAAAAALGWLDGWLAAYVAECAHVVSSIPGAQVRSGHGLAAACACALLAAAYAWRRAQRAEAGLSARRERPPEDRPRAPPPACADR